MPDFIDRFINNDNNWPITDDVSEQFTINNGYTLEHRRDVELVVVCRDLGLADCVRFGIQAQITRVLGAPDSYYGFMWGLDHTCYHACLISIKGTCYIGKYCQSQWSPLCNWVQTPFHSEIGIVNTFAIISAKGILKLKINHQDVLRIPWLEPILGGRGGFILGPTMKIVVSSIRVVTRPKSSVPSHTDIKPVAPLVKTFWFVNDGMIDGESVIHRITEDQVNEFDKDKLFSVTFRQGTQNEDLERIGWTSRRKYAWDQRISSMVEIAEVNVDELAKLEVYLTLCATDLEFPDGWELDNKKIGFTATKPARIADRGQFDRWWGLFPSKWANEVYRCCLEVNPTWGPNNPISKLEIGINKQAHNSFKRSEPQQADLDFESAHNINEHPYIKDVIRNSD
jgi:hypothetical protein